MGGSSSTTTIINNNENPPAGTTVPPPPNFMQNLITWLNAIQGPPIAYTGNPGIDSQNLSKGLFNCTANNFLLTYNYPYMGTLSTPPRYNSSTQALFGQRDFVNAPNNSQLITAYVQNMFQNGGLPQGITSAAISNLVATITTFLQGTVVGWQIQPYHRQYKDSASGDTWIIDAEFIWTCVNAVDYTQSPPVNNAILFMTFMGTFYPIGQPGSPFVDPAGIEIFYNPSRQVVDIWDPESKSAGAGKEGNRS